LPADAAAQKRASLKARWLMQKTMATEPSPLRYEQTNCKSRVELARPEPVLQHRSFGQRPILASGKLDPCPSASRCRRPVQTPASHKVRGDDQAMSWPPCPSVTLVFGRSRHGKTRMERQLRQKLYDRQANLLKIEKGNESVCFPGQLVRLNPRIFL
jgi:hypothetical protein